MNFPVEIGVNPKWNDISNNFKNSEMGKIWGSELLKQHEIYVQNMQFKW